MPIPILGERRPPTNASEIAAGTISATFPDDHTIDGLTLKVENVTAEQIAVVVLYLQRVASNMIDAAMYARRMDDAAVAAVSRDLAAEKGIS